jgi:hypothetical protein
LRCCCGAHGGYLRHFLAGGRSAVIA